MKHELNIEEVKKFDIEVEIAGAFGIVENKSLQITIDLFNEKIKFLVFNKGEMVGKYKYLEDAINAYNLI